ncbi:caspase family protein [Catellatospora aurea]|uniref:Caspase family protein n=1 Tax=Catellatospora aurea TaxID=1337874 RepID=A0ABW2GW35_9ACTN
MSEPGHIGSRPKRYLLTGVVHTYTNAGVRNLPGLVEDKKRIVELFQGFGYEHVTEIPDNPTAQQLRAALDRFFRHEDRRSDDYIVVYLGGHGDITEDGPKDHVLLTSDYDEGALSSSLSSTELAALMLSRTRVRRLLLMVDACYSGEAGLRFAGAATSYTGDLTDLDTRGEQGVIVVSATWPTQLALQGAFTKGLKRAVDALTNGHSGSPLRLERVLSELQQDPDMPASQAIYHQVLRGGQGYMPLFLSGLEHVDAERARRTAEMTDYFMPNINAFVGRASARGKAVRWLSDEAGKPALIVTGNAGTGKTMLLGWLAVASDAERRDAAPRSGGALPRVGAIDVAIYARDRTLSHIVAGIAAAAKLTDIDFRATSALMVQQLLAALAKRGGPLLVVLIDAIDESPYPETLVQDLLVPLLKDEDARIRLILGTRPQVVAFAPELGDEDYADTIDLESPKFADNAAMTEMVRRRLIAPQPTADGSQRPSVFASAPPWLVNAVIAKILQVAQQSYWLAGQLADDQASRDVLPDPAAADWLASVPVDAGRAMRQELGRLGADVDRAIDLLRPLAYAQGDGLPWENIWLAIANSLAPGVRYQPSDLVWLRRNAASYVVTVGGPADRQLYRLSHQALADSLQSERDRVSDERVIVDVLVAAVPSRSDGQRDWANADAYIRMHLAGHAVRAGSIDSLAQDPDFLIAAEPARLLAALDETASPPARAASNAFRRALPALRSQPAEEHMAYLGLAARYARADHLANLIQHGPPWRARWASWRQQRPHIRIPGHREAVNAVVVTAGDRPVVVSGGDDRVLRLSDAQTGAALREPITAHDDAVTTLAASLLGATPVVVSGSADRTVRVWDVTTGEPIGRAFTQHTEAVRAVAVAAVDDELLVVSAGDDTRVRVSSLATGDAAGPPVVHHKSPVLALACFELQQPGRDSTVMIISADEDGKVVIWELKSGRIYWRWKHTRTVHAVAFAEVRNQPVVITGCADSKIFVHNLQTRKQPIVHVGHRQAVRALASMSIGGQPVVAAAEDDGSIRFYSLESREAVGGTLVGHDKAVRALTAMLADGRPMVVSGGVDKTVRIWDLGIQSRTDDPFTGHTLAVTAVATAMLDGAPVVLSAGRDRTIRVWDLVTGSPAREPITGHNGSVTALLPVIANGRPVLISASTDRTVHAWDIDTGRPTGEPYRGHAGHTSSVTVLASATLGGRQVVISAGSDSSVHVWDLATGTRVGRFTGHGGRVRTLAVVRLGGRDVVVSGGEDRAVRLWDLGTCNPVGLPFTRHGHRVLALTVLDHRGRQVVVSGAENSTIRVWDLDSRTLIEPAYTEHAQAVRAIVATRLDDQPIVISGGDDRTARAWRLDDRSAVGHGPVQHSDSVNTLAVSSVGDQPVAVSGSADGSITVWDLDTGINRFARHAHWVRSVEVTRMGGRSVVISGSVDGAVRAWDLNTGRPLARSVVGHHPGLRTLAVARLGRGHSRVVTAGDDNSIRTWGLEGHEGANSVLGHHRDWVRALVVADIQGRHLLVSGGDRTVRVWDLANGTPTGVVYEGHSHWIRALAVAHLHGRPVVLSASADTTVHVWDPLTGTRVGRPFTSHTNAVRAVATGVLDGRPIAVSAGDDTKVRAWCLESREPIGEHSVVSRSDEINAVVVAEPVPRGSDAQRRSLRVVVAAGERVDILKLSADRGWEAETSVEVRSEVLAAALADQSPLVIGSKLGLLALDVHSGPQKGR